MYDGLNTPDVFSPTTRAAKIRARRQTLKTRLARETTGFRVLCRNVGSANQIAELLIAERISASLIIRDLFS